MFEDFPTKEVIHDGVAWLLVIVGWSVVSRGNDRRERRKELRSQLDGLTRELRELEREAREHFQTPGSDKGARARELSIRWRIKNALRIVDRLGQGKIECSSDLKTALRQAVTAGDFDSPERVPSPADSGKLHDVSEAIATLIDALETSFVTTYAQQPPAWQFWK